MKKTRCVILSLSLCAFSSASYSQVVLLGNFPPSNDGTGTSISQSFWKAVSFTMPAQSYDVNSVDLRLVNYNTVIEDTAVVGFFADAAGVPNNAAPIGILTSPTSSSDSAGTFSFSGPVTLNANATYWLVVKATDANTGFTWLTSTTDTPNSRTPTGVISPWTGSYHTALNGTWNAGSVGTFNTFQINATAVPEPAQYTAAGAGALVLFGIARRLLKKG